MLAISGRRWFSFALIALVHVAVYLCSVLKFSMVAMNLHAYDALFYLFSLAQLNFFWQTFPLYALIALGGIAGLVGILLALWWRERPFAHGPDALQRAGPCGPCRRDRQRRGDRGDAAPRSSIRSATSSRRSSARSPTFRN